MPKGESDLDPSLHWAEPELSAPLDQDRGPVIVTATYRVAEEDRPAFLDVLNSLSEERRKDGAYAWGISEDAADPSRFVEWFFVESWAEHLRQHHRVSKADAELQRKLLALHTGPEPPVVTHLIGIDPRGAVVAL